MGVRLRTVAALALAALGLAAGASPASAEKDSPKAMWGPLTMPNGSSAFPVYHELGVGIFEMFLNWHDVAPTRPQSPTDPNDPAYQWPADVSQALQQMKPYNMRLLLVVETVPPWANGGLAYNYPPTHPSDLANFMTAAARHYGTVHLWEIWGEPTRRENLAIDITPARARAPHIYAQMLDASYGALKAVSKRNLVIGGNSYTTGDFSPKQWIDNLRLPNGRPPRMDMYGHNPFTTRDPNLSDPPLPWGWYDFSDLARLSQLVNRELAPPHHTLKLFLSEWTIPTGRDSEFAYYVNNATQAKWIRDAWRIVRRSPFIYALGWIQLYDQPAWTMGGLMNLHGVPKPGYYAWKNG